MLKHLFALVLPAMLLLLLLLWPSSVDRPKPPLLEQLNLHIVRYQNVCLQVVRDSSLHTEGWDTLRQPAFWRQAMELPPEVVLVNVAKTREVVDTLSRYHRIFLSHRLKRAYEDSVKRALGMAQREELYFTNGRSHFYRFDEILPQVDRAVRIFMEEGVDPWYAQAILLIESPGRLQFSTDGAYGAFQLMKGVAREVGLMVSDTLDERADFAKSARGAARLIDQTCLYHTRRLCKKYELDYEETDLWFRLLTMHVYHAGIGNVRRAVRKVHPEQGGMQLITDLWQTKSRRFGNASQNYSQIILATLMILEEMVQTKGLICPPQFPAMIASDSVIWPVPEGPTQAPIERANAPLSLPQGYSK